MFAGCAGCTGGQCAKLLEFSGFLMEDHCHLVFILWNKQQGKKKIRPMMEKPHGEEGGLERVQETPFALLLFIH